MQNFLNELRSNTRLRLGLWLILFILLAYGLLRLNDYQKELMIQYSSAQQQLNKLESIAGQKYWKQRKIDAETLKIELEKRLWKASSQGLARADFQSRLSISLRHAKLDKSRIKVEDIEVLTGTPTLWKVSARIDGVFKADLIAQLLRDMANNPEIIVVERLDIPPKGSKRFNLQVSAYFQANAS